MKKKNQEKDQVLVESIPKEDVQEQQTAEILPEAEPVQDYKLLEEKMAALEAQTRQLREEIGKLKDHKGTIRRKAFRQFLNSPVLHEVTDVYLEYDGKEDQYDKVREYMELHAENVSRIKVELTADMERYKGENLTNLAAAAGILSLAGLVYSATSAGIGMLIVLFVILAFISAGVWMKSKKNTECSRMIIYVLTVLGEME